jgi:hypothetical protein
MVTDTNPLFELAAKDRHTEDCCSRQRCGVCGCHVSTYNANASVIAQRPEADDWDWWVACDNANCEHAYGEGLFQNPIGWVTKA